MLRFLSFLVSVVMFIYLGVYLFLAWVAFMIVVFFVVLIWNKFLSEYLPLPEIGFFAGSIVTIILIVVGTTIYFIWFAVNLPPLPK